MDSFAKKYENELSRLAKAGAGGNKDNIAVAAAALFTKAITGSSFLSDAAQNAAAKAFGGWLSGTDATARLQELAAEFEAEDEKKRELEELASWLQPYITKAIESYNISNKESKKAPLEYEPEKAIKGPEDQNSYDVNKETSVSIDEEVSTEDYAQPDVVKTTKERYFDFANKTIFYADAPARDDMLGRWAFSETLAKRLSRLWKENQQNVSKIGEDYGHSFIMHLYAPWGAGKTTLLGLIEKGLYNNPASDTVGWQVVNFNAWRHQKVTPIWWPLLDQIYRNAASNKIGLRIYERLWRLRVSLSHQLLALTVTILAVLILVIGFIFKDSIVSTPSMKWTCSAISIMGTVWYGILVMTRTLLPGSTASAQSFQRLSSDPMEKVRRHFTDLLIKIERPVMVFIDDLDRCREEYVVNLLESIHTLYNNSRVFYVVAADRRWISSCFANVYQKLGEHIQEPGRSIGYLFLRKIFQISVPVPIMSSNAKNNYMKHLLLDRVYGGVKEDLSIEVGRFKQELETVSTESEILEKLNATAAGEGEEYSSAAMLRLVDEEIESNIEHRLIRFIPLIDANPRSMKLLVHNYGINLAYAIACGIRNINDELCDKIALWTILNMRWPSLADYLMRYPNMVDEFRIEPKLLIGEPNPKPSDWDERVLAFELVCRPEVNALLNGRAAKVETLLDAEFLKLLVGS